MSDIVSSQTSIELNYTAQIISSFMTNDLLRSN